MDKVFKNMFARKVELYQKVNTGYGAKVLKHLSDNQGVALAQIAIFYKGLPNNSVQIEDEVISMGDIADVLKQKKVLSNVENKTLTAFIKKISGSFTKDFYKGATINADTLTYAVALTKTMCCVPPIRIEKSLAAYLFSLMKFATDQDDIKVFGVRCMIMSDVKKDDELIKKNKGIVEFIAGVLVKQYYIMCENMVEKQYEELKAEVIKVQKAKYEFISDKYAKPIKSRIDHNAEKKKGTDNQKKFFNDEKFNILSILTTKDLA